MKKITKKIGSVLEKLGKKKTKRSYWGYVIGTIIVLILCGTLYLNPDLSKNLKTSSFTDIEKQWCEKGGGYWDPVGLGGCGQQKNKADIPSYRDKD